MNTNYRAGAASLFATAARAVETRFTCSRFCQVGEYRLYPGDQLRAVPAGDGNYFLLCDWSAISMGKLTASEINKIAGRQVVE